MLFEWITQVIVKRIARCAKCVTCVGAKYQGVLMLAGMIGMITVTAMASSQSQPHITLNTAAPASDYDYVPQTLLPAAGYHGDKQQQQYQHALNANQRTGMAAGQASAMSMTQHPVAASTWQTASALTGAQQRVWRQSDDYLSLNRIAQQKTRAFIRMTPTPVLYYFVSFAMTQALLQSYLADAALDGGVLVLRGITPGMTLAQFIKKRLLPLLSDRQHHPKVIIDPNLFERYAIDHVPTLLVSHKASEHTGCELAAPRAVNVALRCKAAPPNDYWKLAGSVTSRWALERLQDADAPAAVFLKQLKKITSNHYDPLQ